MQSTQRLDIVFLIFPRWQNRLILAVRMLALPLVAFNLTCAGSDLSSEAVASDFVPGQHASASDSSQGSSNDPLAYDTTDAKFRFELPIGVALIGGSAQVAVAQDIASSYNSLYINWRQEAVQNAYEWQSVRLITNGTSKYDDRDQPPGWDLFVNSFEADPDQPQLTIEDVGSTPTVGLAWKRKDQKVDWTLSNPVTKESFDVVLGGIEYAGSDDDVASTSQDDLHAISIESNVDRSRNQPTFILRDLELLFSSAHPKNCKLLTRGSGSLGTITVSPDMTSCTISEVKIGGAS